MGFYGYFGLDAKNGGRLWEADQNGRHDGQGQGEDHNVLEPLVEYAPVKLQVAGRRGGRLEWTRGALPLLFETSFNQINRVRGIGNKTVAVLAGGGLLAALLVVAFMWSTADRTVPVRDFYPKTPPRRVVISGYMSDTMEPFVSRDGRYLLFNNLNQPPVNTDIFYAERQDDFNWMFRGPVRGVNTPALEGCPTMDRNGQMFFVSPRDYDRTLCTIYTGWFKDGDVTDVRRVESISRKLPGMVNFDVDVSPDGSTLIFVDSRFKPGAGPQFAHLVMAVWDGTHFVRSPDSDRLLARVNQAGLNYAPTISASLRTLFFTRFDFRSGFKGPQIYRATRPTVTVPFDPPEHLAGLGDYVEGSAFGQGERLLYFHRQDGGRFQLYAVSLR